MSSPKRITGKQAVFDFESTKPGARQIAEVLEKANNAKRMDDLTKKSLRQEEGLNKRELLERERENFTQLLMLKCYNGWLKAYDNSAMVLSTWLDGRLGRPYKRNDDAGYGRKAEYGVVSVPPNSVAELIWSLEKAGIKMTFDSEWVLEFSIGERISKEEMVRMLHEDELIIDRVNQLVMPKETLPILRASVKMLLEFVHTQVLNQKITTRDVFLNDVERRAVEMNKMVIATSRGRIDINTCLDEVGTFAEEMYEDATTMSDLRLITARQYKEFVDLIKHVESEQARAIKRQAIKKAELKIEKTRRRNK